MDAADSRERAETVAPPRMPTGEREDQPGSCRTGARRGDSCDRHGMFGGHARKKEKRESDEKVTIGRSGWSSL